MDLRFLELSHLWFIEVGINMMLLEWNCAMTGLVKWVQQHWFRIRCHMCSIGEKLH